MYHLPVETPGGSRMGDRKKVQIWTRKRVARGQPLRPCVMVGKKISDYRTIVPPRKVFFSGGTYPRLMVEKRNRTFFLCHTAHKNSDFSHFPTYIRTTYLCTYHTTRCMHNTLCHTAHKRFINTCRVNPLPCHVLIRPLFTDRLHRCRRCGSLCLLYIRRAS